MKPIFSASKLKSWDQFTRVHEPIDALELMERAAEAFIAWFSRTFSLNNTIFLFCGNGNNGGDGLAICRKLYALKYNVYCIYVQIGHKESQEYITNRIQLLQIGFSQFIEFDQVQSLIQLNKRPVIIDAIFGFGLNRVLAEEHILIINAINTLKAVKIAVDIPSGLQVDKMPLNPCIHANYTFTFQCPKLCQLISDTAVYCGALIISDIGLDLDFPEIKKAEFNFIEFHDVRLRYKARAVFAYKNLFGHCLLVGGSYEMTGAILLSTEAAMRSGVGLASVCTIKENRPILLGKIPEAQFVEPNAIVYKKFQSLLVGPGMGNSEYSKNLLSSILELNRNRLILDADALNIIAENKWLSKIAKHTIITPHVGEFDRLFGKSNNGFERLEKARNFAFEYSIYIILKGKYTAICTPEKMVYFNSSGNVGLAKAGSGDVLSGILVALLAQDYTILDACILGVYLHGHSADICLQNKTVETFLPSDVINNLTESFKTLIQ